MLYAPALSVRDECIHSAMTKTKIEGDTISKCITCGHKTIEKCKHEEKIRQYDTAFNDLCNYFVCGECYTLLCKPHKEAKCHHIYEEVTDIRVGDYKNRYQCKDCKFIIAVPVNNAKITNEFIITDETLLIQQMLDDYRQ